MSSTTYADLKSKNTLTINILNFFGEPSDCKYLSEITFRQKYKYLLTIVPSKPIPKAISYEWYEAIEDHSIEFGKTVEKRKNKYKKVISQWISNMRVRS